MTINTPQPGELVKTVSELVATVNAGRSISGNGIVLESNTPHDLVGNNTTMNTVLNYDTVYSLDGEVLDLEPLPEESGLSWVIGADAGYLAVSTEGIWRIGYSIVFAEDATGRGALAVDEDVIGGYLSPWITLSDDSYYRGSTGTFVVRLIPNSNVRFVAIVHGATSTSPAALVQYAMISMVQLV